MKRLAKRIWRKYNREGERQLLVDGMWYVGCSSQRMVEATHPFIYLVSKEYYLKKWLSEREIGSFSRPPDPTAVFWIDPKQITYITRRPKPSVNKSSNIGRVICGDWDKSSWEFERSAIYQSVQQRYVEGMGWEETKVVRDRIPPWDLDSVKQIRQKGVHMDQLWKSIRENGYFSQIELCRTKPERYQEKFYPHTLTNEITVDIGRNGEFLFADSFHRLSMAKILGLDSVPVTVLARHHEWMDYRDDILKKDKVPVHPDLNKIGV